MQRLNSLIAAKQALRQHESLQRADAAGDACDRILAGIWRDLLAATEAKDVARVNAIWNGLARRIGLELLVSFRGLAVWGYESAADVLKTTLPKKYVEAIPFVHNFTHKMSGFSSFGTQTVSGQGVINYGNSHSLREADEPAAPWLEFLDILLPAPTEEFVNRVVFASDGIPWTERLSTLSRLATPETMAAVASQGYLAGENQQQIAKRLLPVVENVRASARRVARTEGLNVAHRAQMACHAQLGDLVIGYQVHDAMGPNARTDHAARSGTIYYREPKPGQIGMELMPEPPIDKGGPHEDGAGVKPNCRCWLTPVLRPATDLNEEQIAVFQNNAGAVIPNVATYDSWFRDADVKNREQAVGVRRYRTMAARLEHSPEWEDFLDPVSGRLLPLSHLQAETFHERARRVMDAKRLLAKHAADRRAVATFGSVEPPKPREQPVKPKKPYTLTGPGGKVIEFVKTKHDKNRVRVVVNVAKFDAAWRLDSGYYIPPGGGGAEIKGRRPNFEKFLAKGIPVEAPTVYLDDQGRIGFTDGRHRFSWLRDTGWTRVVVTVNKDQAEKFKALFS